MQIWVDADACPKQIKDILYRAAVRKKIIVTLVSNHALTTPTSPFIQKLQVGAGFDVADNKIVDKIHAGDLVITADIPLADAVINKQAVALNPRGELYTRDNIKERLAIRNLSHELRSSGAISGGPASLSKRDIQQFANQLDSFLQKSVR